MWLKLQHFLNRFDAEDMVFAAHFVMNMILMACIGVSAGTCYGRGGIDEQASCPVFTGSLAGLRLLHVTSTLYVLPHNLRFTNYLTRQISGDSIIGVLWLAVTFTTGEANAGLWWTAVVMDVGMSLLPLAYSFVLDNKSGSLADEPIPLSPDLLVSRHNRFQIITYAYVVSGALATLRSPQLLGREATIIAMACILVACMKIQYFDLQPVARPSDTDAFGSRHPTLRGQVFRTLWEICHFPLNLSTVLVGSTMKLFAKDDGQPLQRYFLAVPLGVTSIMTLLQQLLADGGMAGFRKRRWPKQRRILIRFVFAALIMILAPICDGGRLADDIGFLILVVMTFLFAIFGDVYSRMPNYASHAFSKDATTGRLVLADGLLARHNEGEVMDSTRVAPASPSSNVDAKGSYVAPLLANVNPV
eukprot:UC1_evm3s138